MPENAFILKAAINDWKEKKGNALDESGKPICKLSIYARIVGVPYNTLVKYVTNISVCCTVGAQAGKKPLLSKLDQRFIAEVLARKGRANDGAEMSTVVEYLQEINPNMTLKQGRDHFYRTLDPNNRDLIKKRLVCAQGTTSKHSAVTVAQQFRWFNFIDSCYNTLRTKNTGFCKCGCNKTFGELIDFFVVGGDKTCIMAGKFGEVRIVGLKTTKKHEKKNKDSRKSITMFRTGDSRGNTGPSLFLIKGEPDGKLRRGYNDQYLMNHGAAEGSTIVKNPSAFMDTDTWEKVTLQLIKGYRKINRHVEANPDWWMLEIVDGFGAHFASLEALELR